MTNHPHHLDDPAKPAWRTRLKAYETHRMAEGISHAEGLVWLLQESTPETYGAIVHLVRKGRKLPQHVLNATIQAIESMLLLQEPRAHVPWEAAREAALREDIQTLVAALDADHSNDPKPMFRQEPTGHTDGTEPWWLLPAIRKEAEEQLIEFNKRNSLQAPDADQRQAAAWIAENAASRIMRAALKIAEPQKIWPPDTKASQEAKKAEFNRLHPRVKVSKGIHDALTFGTGELDEYGFWEHEDYEAARAWERLHPEDGECWPHTKAQLAAHKPTPDKAGEPATAP